MHMVRFALKHSITGNHLSIILDNCKNIILVHRQIKYTILQLLQKKKKDKNRKTEKRRKEEATVTGSCVTVAVLGEFRSVECACRCVHSVYINRGLNPHSVAF